MVYTFGKKLYYNKILNNKYNNKVYNKLNNLTKYIFILVVL